MSRISALPNTLTSPAKEDLFAVVDDGDDETKKMTLGTLLNLIYPIGSIYTNATDDTNPGTLFGFGTWAAFATGRVLVGMNGSDSDFNTEEQTGGQKTVQEHAHDIRTYNDDMNSSGGSGGVGPSFYKNVDVPTQTLNSFGGIVMPAGAGATNMNPYIVVHMWKRTA